ALAEDGELDRCEWPVRHGPIATSIRTGQPTGRARSPGPLLSQIEAEARTDSRTGDFIHAGLDGGHRECSRGVGTCGVDGPAVPPQEHALAAEHIVRIPE